MVATSVNTDSLSVTSTVAMGINNRIPSVPRRTAAAATAQQPPTTPELFVANTINIGVDLYEDGQYDQALMAFAHALAFTKRIDIEWMASATTPSQQQQQEQQLVEDEHDNDDEDDDQVVVEEEDEDDEGLDDSIIMVMEDDEDNDDSMEEETGKMTSTNVHHHNHTSSFHNSMSSLDHSASLLLFDDDGDDVDVDVNIGDHHDEGETEQRQQEVEQLQQQQQQHEHQWTRDGTSGPFQPTFGKSPLDDHHDDGGRTSSRHNKKIIKTEDNDDHHSKVLVFLNPIKVPFDTLPVTNTRKTFSLIALFNLAIGYHQRAIAGNNDENEKKQQRQTEEERQFFLRKALSFYELAYSVQMQEGIDMTLTPTMVIMSNVGHIHRSLGNIDHSIQCFQHLLSTLMFLVEAGEAQDLRDGLFEFDNFFDNILKTLYTHSPAPAA